MEEDQQLGILVKQNTTQIKGEANREKIMQA